jgi:Flp pilus assembly protein TadD/SAM-dependent methyltransferase
MATGPAPHTDTQTSRQQRRRAARLANKGRGDDGVAAQTGADAAAHEIDAATRYLHAGDVQMTVEICRRLLDGNPNYPPALHVMGLAAMQTAQFSVATDLFRRAITTDARDHMLRFNLGTALANLGRFEDAAACFREAISLKPDCAWSHGHLGKALRVQGRTDEGVSFLRQAVKLAPKDPGMHFDLGCALEALGRTDDAIQCYLQALSIDPDFAECRRRLAVALGDASFVSISDALLRELEACLVADDVDKRTLVKATTGILKLDNNFAKFIESGSEDRDQAIEAYYRECGLDAAMNSRIFRLLLQQVVLTDPDFEISLTTLRKVMLFQIVSGDRQPFEPKGEKFGFLCSLAEQCFNNEYAYGVSDEERRKLDDLETRIEAGLSGLPRLPDELQIDLMCFSMYRPLHTLNACQDLPRSDAEAWDEAARCIAKRQLDDYDQERRIAAAIRPITNICDAVSLAVREQYEENPYPRWLTIDRQTPKPVSLVAKALFPHFATPEFLNGSPRILVAGCGTGRHAVLTATRFRDAEVLAVDLSAASLAYGARMAKQLGIANIRFRQADILALSNLDMRFGIIECAGVLHHMEDPIAGWKVLTELLQPHGLMRLGLYSERARDSVSTTREWAERNGFDASRESMRRCRQAILRLPEEDPKREVLKWRDFYSMSGCRDLLFHAQEHRFTLPRIEEILEDLGLRFLGFEFQVPTAPRSYRSRFPEDAEMADLRRWDELETRDPKIFSTMYQFWCQKT